ncbi:putative divalent cation/proton antiporter TMEM165 isoform X1 [Dermacentor andersoni]|uniref:putative divalent cation/proton antiporter TMEM165 isoform X1 n=1 Tax=Dermacentor andersoni TaxID=34620 RepID=UPI00215563FC|nr:transmembrane protein 165-like isoform X1 [Dermacentor andersoni]
MYPQLIVALSLLVGACAYVADQLQGAAPNLEFHASEDVFKPAATPTSGADVSPEANTEFWHGFIGAISVIIVSELGDKTFFIAAILAMRHSRLVVFGGAIAALSIMTVLSAGLGFVTTVIPRIYTHYLSIGLFVFFGVRMIKEAYYMPADEGMDEYEEVQKSLSKKEMDDSASQARDSVVNMEAGSSSVSFRWRLRLFLSQVFFQALTLTFVAEWGDRSQIATIILAAREDPVAVSLGAILGHSLCTLLAVIGGRLVAQWISVRTVTFIGGVVFLVFAVSSLYLGSGEKALRSL